MKGCIVIIYIQEYITENGELHNDSILKWSFFVIQKLIGT